MSSLLALAKYSEQQSKAQQQSTNEMLKTAISEHEQCVKAELSASGKRISAAISAHEQSMIDVMQPNRLSVLRLAGKMWFIIVTVSVLLATSGSVLWWQGQKIVTNANVIS